VSVISKNGSIIFDSFIQQFSSKQVIDIEEIVAIAPWLLKSGVKFNNAVIRIHSNGDDIVWESGLWLGGEWFNGNWFDGDWQGGEWYNGDWKSGVWESGVWKTGYINDYNRDGNYNDSWEWVGEYVRSSISPDEYWDDIKCESENVM